MRVGESSQYTLSKSQIFVQCHFEVKSFSLCVSVDRCKNEIKMNSSRNKGMKMNMYVCVCVCKARQDYSEPACTIPEL